MKFLYSASAAKKTTPILSFEGDIKDCQKRCEKLGLTFFSDKQPKFINLMVRNIDTSEIFINTLTREGAKK